MGVSRVCSARGPAWVLDRCGCRTDGAGAGQSQPVMRRLPRLPPLKGSWPKNGMLERSMSTLIAWSEVAARMTDTSQVLRLWPLVAAFSSALVLIDSGMRSVMRARSPSSTSSGPGRGRRRGSGRCDARRCHLDHEVELAAVEPHVHAALGQLGADLGRGLGDGLHEGQAGAGVQRVAQALGHLAGLVATGLGGGQQVAAEAVDVRRDVHAHHYDITMTSSQGFLMSGLSSRWCGAAPDGGPAHVDARTQPLRCGRFQAYDAGRAGVVSAGLRRRLRRARPGTTNAAAGCPVGRVRGRARVVRGDAWCSEVEERARPRGCPRRSWGCGWPRSTSAPGCPAGRGSPPPGTSADSVGLCGPARRRPPARAGPRPPGRSLRGVAAAVAPSAGSSSAAATVAAWLSAAPPARPSAVGVSSEASVAPVAGADCWSDGAGGSSGVASGVAACGSSGAVAGGAAGAAAAGAATGVGASMSNSEPPSGIEVAGVLVRPELAAGAAVSSAGTSATSVVGLAASSVAASSAGASSVGASSVGVESSVGAGAGSGASSVAAGGSSGDSSGVTSGVAACGSSAAWVAGAAAGAAVGAGASRSKSEPPSGIEVAGVDVAPDDAGAGASATFWVGVGVAASPPAGVSAVSVSVGGASATSWVGVEVAGSPLGAGSAAMSKSEPVEPRAAAGAAFGVSALAGAGWAGASDVTEASAPVSGWAAGAGLAGAGSSAVRSKSEPPEPRSAWGFAAGFSAGSAGAGVAAAGSAGADCSAGSSPPPRSKSEPPEPRSVWGLLAGFPAGSAGAGAAAADAAGFSAGSSPPRSNSDPDSSFFGVPDARVASEGVSATDFWGAVSVLESSTSKSDEPARTPWRRGRRRRSR